MPVEIGGLDAQRSFVSAECELVPLNRVQIPQEFYSLAYMHVRRLPEARLGLHSPTQGDAYIIPPHGWGNIWIEGEQILLAGWLTHEEFRGKASVLNAGMRTFQFAHTRSKNLQVRADRLNPLGIFLESVRKWEAEKKSA